MRMRTNNSRYLQPALSTIAHYDAPLASRIWNSGELITVVSNPYEMLSDLLDRGVHPMVAMALVDSMGEASGLTVSPTFDHGSYPEELLPVRGNIFLREDALADVAKRIGTTPDRVAAATLAHEWKHHDGYGEAPAYDAGAAFARKMGEYALAREEEETKATGVAREQERNAR
jgi:hypothetical protein